MKVLILEYKEIIEENKIIKPKSIFWERKKERENNKTEINKNSLNRNVDRKRSKRTKIVK